ncbi:MAG: hypothetical protein ABWW69_03765 [Pyrodictiaceae archaeon]
MPTCPKAIVTSKPGKEHWTLEELWDTLYEIDDTVDIKETRYRGVFLVFTGKTSVYDLAGAFTRKFHAFIRSVVPALICLRRSDLDALINSIDTLLKPISGPLRVIFRIRGPLKKYIKPEVVEELLRRKGIEVHDSSAEALVIEAVDDIVILAAGSIGSCGDSCIIIIPHKL